MPFALSCQSGRFRAMATGLLLGLSYPVSGAYGAEETPPMAAEQPASEAATGMAVEEMGGREALLNELTAVANALEAQRKANESLNDRFDALNRRMEELEVRNKEQSALIKTLQISLSGIYAGRDEKNATRVPVRPEGQPEGEAMAPPKPEAEGPGPEAGQEDLPGEFETFLDMGEAMLRRFFGVVKEFRKEFEDNRV